jgi:hypothetical protein
VVASALSRRREGGAELGRCWPPSPSTKTRSCEGEIRSPSTSRIQKIPSPQSCVAGSTDFLLTILQIALGATAPFGFLTSEQLSCFCRGTKQNQTSKWESLLHRTARGTRQGHAPLLPTGRPRITSVMWDDRPPLGTGSPSRPHAITAEPAAAKPPGQVRRCRSSLQRTQCHRRLVAYPSLPMQIMSCQVALPDSHREDDGGWPGHQELCGDHCHSWDFSGSGDEGAKFRQQTDPLTSSELEKRIGFSLPQGEDNLPN